MNRIASVPRSLAWAVALGVVLMAAPANAIPVTKDVTFSGSPVQDFLGVSVPPVDPVTGSFSITLDPTLTYTNSGGITSESVNLVVSSSWVFNYDPGTDRLEVGGSSAGADTVIFDPSTNDFWLFINGFLSGSPTFVQIGYSQTSVSARNLFGTLSGNGTVSVVDPPPPQVPVPAALPLFATGLGLLGIAGWRRKRKSAA